MFGRTPAKTPTHARNQPRPGGAVNRGGQQDSGRNTSFQLPSKATGTQKRHPAGAHKGLQKAKNPAQNGSPNIPMSLQALVK